MQGLGRIRFFGLQIRFYLLFYLRVRCLFRIALELCNYRAVFTYQVKTAELRYQPDNHL